MEDAAEYYETAGTSWQVFQDHNNFNDNPLVWFKQIPDADDDSSIHESGVTGQTLQTFYDCAANGTLPEVSYVVGPA